MKKITIEFVDPTRFPMVFEGDNLNCSYRLNPDVYTITKDKSDIYEVSKQYVFSVKEDIIPDVEIKKSGLFSLLRDILEQTKITNSFLIGNPDNTNNIEINTKNTNKICEESKRINDFLYGKGLVK